MKRFKEQTGGIQNRRVIMKNYTATHHIFTNFCFLFLCIVGLQVQSFAAGGDLDLTFTTGVTTSGSTAVAVAVQTDGRVLVGGNFTVVNGSSYNRLVRLNVDGTLDPSFDIGTGFSFADVRAIAVQTDGRILVGGNFTTFNGTLRPYFVRLNANRRKVLQKKHSN